jgi:hypothetical protein
MDATEPQSGLKTIKNLLFFNVLYYLFKFVLSEVEDPRISRPSAYEGDKVVIPNHWIPYTPGHNPVHDSFYVVFQKAVTSWYLRNHPDLRSQQNPATKRLKIHTYIICRYNE